MRFFISAIILASAVPANADMLYALTAGTSPATLYRIDTSTGGAVAVVTLGAGTGDTDVDVLNGLLYASNVIVGGNASFGTIDPSTGAFTVIISSSAYLTTLAANPSAGVLYANVGGTGVLGTLISITPSGTVKIIGDTNLLFTDLAFDTNHGILYGTALRGFLYTLNTSTGAPTLVGQISGVPSCCLYGIGYDNANNTLFLNAGQEHNLYTVNTSTAAATLVGSNGVSVLLESLSDLATPEPATWPLTALGLAALAFARLRR